MVFSSLEFIFGFLPAVFFAYAASLCFFRKKNYQFTALNLVLLVSSVIFYTKGEKIFFWVMLAVGFIDYFIALAIENDRRRVQPSRFKQQSLLKVSVISNMGLLFYFKYSGFVGHILFDILFDILGVSKLGLFSLRHLSEIALPIGISFYTFESMSYIVDVYRGEVKATRRLIDYWTFITFFPHLVAGPIIRYAALKAQLEGRTHDWNKVNEGFRRFAIGLGKKVIIANPIGSYADVLFALDPTRVDVTLAWITAISYALQIYFDFSGYSDMAIGLAKIFGISLPENFNYPYIARNMRDFWKRWHITLSRWFRDYVYIPSGGNRHGIVREYRNLLIVFILCGLWHGASWNFVVWGAFHGFFLVAERVASGWHLKLNLRLAANSGSRSSGFTQIPSMPRLLQHIYALVVITLSWVIFRAETLTQVWRLYKAMFGGGSGLISNDTIMLLHRPHFYVYFLLGLIFSVPIVNYVGETWARKLSRPDSLWGEALPLMIFAIAIFLLCGQEHNPFIYFRF